MALNKEAAKFEIFAEERISQKFTVTIKGDWFRGIILASGARGPGFD
jgi:hypothetical protein